MFVNMSRVRYAAQCEFRQQRRANTFNKYLQSHSYEQTLSNITYLFMRQYTLGVHSALKLTDKLLIKISNESNLEVKSIKIGT